MVNAVGLAQAIAKKYPGAELINETFMDDISPMEQFQFWHRHDLIITVHGAPITNAILCAAKPH